MFRKVSHESHLSARLRKIAVDLRSPAEKALGLEQGELYGKDEVAINDLGTKTIEGYKVEFSENSETGSIEAWVKGLGIIEVFASWEKNIKESVKTRLKKYNELVGSGVSEKDALKQIKKFNK
jgi:hypothetical protein